MKQPKAVTYYLAEFEETEPDFRVWLTRQKSAFDSLIDKNTDLAGWIALKMGCTARSAQSVIKWAGLTDY